MDRIIAPILCLILVLSACDPEQKPAILAPGLALDEAREITRTTALISGQISLRQQGTVTNCRFIYDVAENPENGISVPVSETQGYTEVLLSGLKAGTTYYYAMEAGNGYSVVRSDIRHFTTQPNSKPALGEISLINKGPFSAALQCTLTDNGGEELTFLGFKYRKMPDEEEQFAAAQQIEGEVFKVQLTTLAMETPYSVRAYAANSIGEVFSGPIEFITDHAIFTTIPGTLSDIIDPEQKYTLTQLSISGNLNGTDLRLLRDLLGQGINGQTTPGRLQELDLTDATLVAGGLSYQDSRYSKNDTLGSGTFADCSKLEKLVLPRNIRVIEKDAFKNCTSLTSLTLPDNVSQYTASSGCSQLQAFTVSPLNLYYSSKEGVLYDKNQTVLLQYPEGKQTDHFQIPGEVRKLASYSFLQCRQTDLDIPSSVTELGEQVFRASQLQTVTIGTGITTLPKSTFEDCRELTRVTLSSETGLICNYCFSGCRIEHLYIQADYPPVCEPKAFANTDMPANCILHVPAGCKTLYKNSNSWKQFTRIVEEQTK